ncbi:MAG: phosphotransferase family protein [Pseudomonadales bacterium]
MTSSFESLLESVLRQRVINFESLLACDRLTAGASQETYRIRARIDGEKLTLALRRASEDMGTLEGDSIGLEAEAQLLQLATAAGIPAPAIHYLLSPEDGLGAGFLMEWLEGETLGSRIVRSESLAGVRPKLARQCGEILARIHSMDYEAAGLSELLSVVTPQDRVRQTWGLYRNLDTAQPMIDYVARWMLDNLPTTERMSLVHGDFRNGNLMVNSQGINAVLDWELAHIGDPVRDLGWLCVNSWRFGNSQLAVGGFGNTDDLLAGYRSVSTMKFSAQDLHFWQLFGSFWWSVTCLRMGESYRSGTNLSVERPAIGRRSSEAQMDCVNLLIPGDYSLPTNQLVADTQLPTSAEILVSVAAFLKEEVTAITTDRVKFLARVAGNALDIVSREINIGPELQEQERQRLAELLGERGSLTDLRRQLIEKLRAGLALDTAGLAEHLRLTVAGQLAIDQPNYSALQKITS